MRRKRHFRQPLSIALALAMAITQMPVRAIAAEDATETVYVETDSTTGDQSVTVGNITVDEYSCGAAVEAQDATSASLTVEGDILSGSSNYALAVDPGSTATLDVQGDVSAGDSVIAHASGEGAVAVANVDGTIDSTGYGVQSGAWTDGESTITVGNGISAYGVGISSIVDEGGTATTNVTGDVTSEYIYAISTTDFGGTTYVTVDGDVTSNGDEAINVYGTGDSFTAVTVNGNVTSTVDATVYVSTTEDATAYVFVNGNAETGQNALTAADDGVVLYAYDNSDANVNVTGSVDAAWFGMDVNTSDEAVGTVVVTGDITAGDKAILAEAEDSSILNAVVGGSVVSKDSNAIDVEALDDSNATVIVVGDVSADSEWISAASAWSLGGRASVGIFGDVTAENGCGAELGSYSDNSLVNFYLYGDLTGGYEGLWTGIYADSASVDALVTGTISGGDAAVALDGEDGIYTASNLDLTVWKIVPVDGVVAADAVYNYDPITDEYLGATYTENEEFEAGIKYIIKVEQPETGATITATDANGQPLETSHYYDFAYEGEKVLLKVDLDEGYVLTGAYNGDGEKVPLEQDADGNWYVVVAKGGGVYLSVEVEKAKYQVVFVNDDGTELQSSVVEHGETPVYSGAVPTKASTDRYDYTFAGWTPEIDVATGDITYKATFTETARKQDVTPEPKPAGTASEPASATPAGNTMLIASNTLVATQASVPETGDATNAVLPLALAGAGLALIALRRKFEHE